MTQLITDTAALSAALAPLADVPLLALDTEFYRTTTYNAELCLVQLAVGTDDKDCFLIDTRSPDLDAGVLWDFLRRSTAVKLWHSPRQDLEILYQHAGFIPEPLADTQVMAALCGQRSGIGYDKLISGLLGIHLDKGSQFSDWRVRPLSAKQLSYAADDVRYLWQAYSLLRADLERLGRLSWLEEEMTALLDPAQYQTQPETAWQRLNVGKFPAHAQHRIKALAAWREATAQQRNVPRGHVLKDDKLIDIAERPAKNSERLESLIGAPVPATLWDAYSAAATQKTPLLSLPPQLSKKEQRLLDFWKLLLGLKADAAQLDSALLCTSAQLETFVRRGTWEHLNSRWRQQLLSEMLSTSGEQQVVWDTAAGLRCA